MRWVIRFFLVIVFMLGVVLAILYPWASDTMPGYEVGKWPVYDRETGFAPAEVRPAPSENPLWVTIEILSDGTIDNPDGVIVLTMTATAGNRTIRAETFTLEGIAPRPLSPQSSERLYRVGPIRIDDADGSPLSFVFGPGEDDFPIQAVDLTVSAGAIDIDGDALIVGYAMMGISFLLILLTFRGRRKAQGPKAPRWGRQ